MICDAIVLARGGSKGIPRKNIVPVYGKPLIAWTIEAALASGFIRDVVVSTDSEEIADTARSKLDTAKALSECRGKGKGHGPH